VNSPDLSQLRAEIDKTLASFAAERSVSLLGIGPELAPVAKAMSDFITQGGKRFRPIFAYLGYLGSGAEPRAEVLRACTSLELVHVCALIHDDLMDGSNTRRNKPAIHKAFQQYHQDASYNGSSERFGSSSAILLGDLALVWADRLLVESGISGDELLQVQSVFGDMRDELMAGQYLDVLEGALATTSIDRALKVARFKSGKYSIERPLHFGAALSGKKELMNTYSSFGLPLGEAFQLRDDLLGVFGDPDVTGKPAGDDLREGKRTVLIALTMELVDQKDRDLLSASLGKEGLDRTQILQLQEIISSSGAIAQVEKLITELRDKAISALRDGQVEASVVSVLEEMATMTTQRSL